MNKTDEAIKAMESLRKIRNWLPASFSKDSIRTQANKIIDDLDQFCSRLSEYERNRK